MRQQKTATPKKKFHTAADGKRTVKCWKCKKDTSEYEVLKINNSPHFICKGEC